MSTVTSWRDNLDKHASKSKGRSSSCAAGAKSPAANTVNELHFNNKKQKTKKGGGSSHCGSVEMNLTSIQGDEGSIPGLAQ